MPLRWRPSRACVSARLCSGVACDGSREAVGSLPALAVAVDLEALQRGQPRVDVVALVLDVLGPESLPAFDAQAGTRLLAEGNDRLLQGDRVGRERGEVELV